MPFSAEETTEYLGWSAAQVAEQRERDLQHVVTRAREVEQRAEQHEEEDELHRDAERDAVHALGREPEVRDEARHRRALVLDHVRHVGAGKDVEQEESRRDQHAEAHRPARGLEHDRDPGQSHGNVERRGLARTRGDLVVEQEQVRGAERADQREHPIGDWDHGARRALEGGERDKGQEDREHQVDRARLGVVEDSDAEDERQRRRVPDLEQRPRRGDEREQRTDVARGLTCAEVGFLDAFGCLDRSSDEFGLCGHAVSSRKKGRGSLARAPMHLTASFDPAFFLVVARRAFVQRG